MESSPPLRVPERDGVREPLRISGTVYMILSLICIWLWLRHFLQTSVFYSFCVSFIPSFIVSLMLFASAVSAFTLSVHPCVLKLSNSFLFLQPSAHSLILNDSTVSTPPEAERVQYADSDDSALVEWQLRPFRMTNSTSHLSDWCTGDVCPLAELCQTITTLLTHKLQVVEFYFAHYCLIIQY